VCTQYPYEGAAWDIPAPSSSVAATLRVVDVSSCHRLRSLDFVRSCVQLRCLSMAWCFGVTDLSPLGACSETLEELWMAHSHIVGSLAPLAACTRLRKLDLRGCRHVLLNQVEGLQLAQLADPQSVKIEGLVHELQPNIRPLIQQMAAGALRDLADHGAQTQAAITAAGAIPALEWLQESSPLADVRQAAAEALENLPH
jgi:hypothetical protein